MRWRKRRTAASTSTEVVLAPRVERALVAIASHAEQLDGRILRLERRLDDATLEFPTQEDLLEVRMHSAKVAAELARVTVELRAEIEDRVAASAVKESRLRTLAESIADLSDALDTTSQDWAASA
ncbi:MAG: hypothetical protein JOZ68_13435 [Acidimicrobiia bacterium]|nr:hypothetical protein [Acidimicrobiia bacterium]MBV9042005.1 hypothetical protein [Acidimicrobiia bacterium]